MALAAVGASAAVTTVLGLVRSGMKAQRERKRIATAQALVNSWRSEDTDDAQEDNYDGIELVRIPPGRGPNDVHFSKFAALGAAVDKEAETSKAAEAATEVAWVDMEEESEAQRDAECVGLIAADAVRRAAEVTEWARCRAGPRGQKIAALVAAQVAGVEGEVAAARRAAKAAASKSAATKAAAAAAWVAHKDAQAALVAAEAAVGGKKKKVTWGEPEIREFE